MRHFSPLQICVGINLLIEKVGQLRAVEVLAILLPVLELLLEVRSRVLKKLLDDVEGGAKLRLVFDGIVFEGKNVGVLVEHSLFAVDDELSGGFFVVDLLFDHSQHLSGGRVLDYGYVSEPGVLDLVFELEGFFEGTDLAVVLVGQSHLHHS